MPLISRKLGNQRRVPRTVLTRPVNLIESGVEDEFSVSVSIWRNLIRSV